MASDIFDLEALATKSEVNDIAADYNDDFKDGDEIAFDEALTNNPGNVSPSPLPSSDASALEEDFLYDFYYRIWVFPDRLSIRNPRIGIDIPFSVWNAYPYPNNLTAINVTGDGTGLTLDLTAPTLFREIEYKTVNIQIGPTADIDIDASFEFDFSEGSALFNFLADRISILTVAPNIPVKETWEWLTDVITTDNGLEQRISLRAVPRRALQTKLVSLTKDEVKSAFDEQMFSFVREVLIPYFQYAAIFKQEVSIGATTLYINASRTDLRVGEYALVINDEDSQLVTVVDVNVSDIEITPALGFEGTRRTWVVPLFQSIAKDGSVMNRMAVDDVAETTINSMATVHRTPFARPGSATVFSTIDGYTILDKRPLANQDPPEVFRTGTRITDFDTGLLEINTEWIHTFLEGSRQYLIKRQGNFIEMDYWRDFLEIAKGRRNSFLTPTFREDLYVTVPPTSGGDELKVTGSRYSESYFDLETHKYLRLWTSEGTYDVRALSAVADSGNDVVNFTPPLPVGVGWTEITHISFLLKVRLGDDTVTLEHYDQDTILSLTLRTVDE